MKVALDVAAGALLEVDERLVSDDDVSEAVVAGVLTAGVHRAAPQSDRTMVGTAAVTAAASAATVVIS